MTNNKLISTTPSLEEILQQLPITETYTADIQTLAIIKTALIFAILFTVVNCIIGEQFYPAAVKDGFTFSVVAGLFLSTTRLILKKLCYPHVTIIDEQGIHIRVKSREKITTTWQQIVQISKRTDMSNSWVICKIAPQIDKPKFPKRICLRSKIYDIDTSITILEMLRQHFTNPNSRILDI